MLGVEIRAFKILGGCRMDRILNGGKFA